MALLVLVVACGGGSVGEHPDDTGLTGLALEGFAPAALVPGSRVVLTGHSFVDETYGETWAARRSWRPMWTATTMTHELGHSLGLAVPDEPDAYHNPGDRPNRLMDAGNARTLRERAELDGEGPARFCDGDFAYLRAILPSQEQSPAAPRPTCDQPSARWTARAHAR